MKTKKKKYIKKKKKEKTKRCGQKPDPQVRSQATCTCISVRLMHSSFLRAAVALGSLVRRKSSFSFSYVSKCGLSEYAAIHNGELMFKNSLPCNMPTANILFYDLSFVTRLQVFAHTLYSHVDIGFSVFLQLSNAGHFIHLHIIRHARSYTGE